MGRNARFDFDSRLDLGLGFYVVVSGLGGLESRV